MTAKKTTKKVSKQVVTPNGHTTIKLSSLKKNPNNPRLIKDAKFKGLCKSIKEFPQMMELRPIITDNSNVVLGGNMRLEALKAIGYTEVPAEWVKRADQLTEAQKREFIIKDNNSFGEYDWDVLANEWDQLPLDDWGVDIPSDWLKADTAPEEHYCNVIAEPEREISKDDR